MTTFRPVTVTGSPPAPESHTETRTDIIGDVAVRHQTTTNADGTVTETATVPVVAAGANGINLPVGPGAQDLLAHVSAGHGLVASGPGGALPGAAASSALTALLAQHGGAELVGTIGGSIGTAGGAPLLVRAVVPTLAGAPNGQIALSGAADASEVALVIDARAVPAGMAMQLDHVEFAAVIGAVTLGGGAGSQRVWGDSANQTIILGEGDDELHGGGGNDVVGSAAGNDRIFGDAGDDTVFGGAGNDTIDGGSGHDVLRLAGSSRADYTLRVVDGALVVTQRGGTDGTDTVTGVEALRFETADTSAAGTLERLYEALFGRPADAGGRDFWLGAHAAGRSLHDVAAGLLGADEGTATGALSNEAYVAQLYAHALGRTAGSAEIAYWTNRMGAGELDRAGVLLAVTESAEKLGQGTTLDFNHSDVAAIARLYDMAFGRAADAAGLNGWIAASEAGMTATSIARAFVGSAEAAALYGGIDDAAFVARLYETGLDRAATSTELARWTGMLAGGALDRAGVLLALSESFEHVTLVGAIDTSVHAV